MFLSSVKKLSGGDKIQKIIVKLKNVTNDGK